MNAIVKLHCPNYSIIPVLTLFKFLICFFLTIIFSVVFQIYSAAADKVTSTCGIVTLCVIVTTLGYIVSPFISLLLALIVLPLALLYFYCFIPIHLIVTNVRNNPRRTNIENV